MSPLHITFAAKSVQLLRKCPTLTGEELIELWNQDHEDGWITVETACPGRGHWSSGKADNFFNNGYFLMLQLHKMARGELPLSIPNTDANGRGRAARGASSRQHQLQPARTARTPPADGRGRLHRPPTGGGARRRGRRGRHRARTPPGGGAGGGARTTGWPWLGRGAADGVRKECGARSRTAWGHHHAVANACVLQLVRNNQFRREASLGGCTGRPSLNPEVVTSTPERKRWTPDWKRFRGNRQGQG
jgi:hypothetical protein